MILWKFEILKKIWNLVMPTLHRRYTLETRDPGYSEKYINIYTGYTGYKRSRRYRRHGGSRRSRKLTEERASPPNSGAKPEHPMCKVTIFSKHGAKPSPPDWVSKICRGMTSQIWVKNGGSKFSTLARTYFDGGPVLSKK